MSQCVLVCGTTSVQGSWPSWLVSPLACQRRWAATETPRSCHCRLGRRQGDSEERDPLWHHEHTHTTAQVCYISGWNKGKTSSQTPTPNWQMIDPLTLAPHSPHPKLIKHFSLQIVQSQCVSQTPSLSSLVSFRNILGDLNSSMGLGLYTLAHCGNAFWTRPEDDR